MPIKALATSIEEDRAAVEKFAAAGIDFLVASSFSKNFGLYNERTGALTIVSPTAEESVVALSHAKLVVRVNYSNPPAHGGLAASTVLADSALYDQWIGEVAEMRERIKKMRVALVDGLAARGVKQDFSFIKEQRGMFSFSGLSNDIVAWLKEKQRDLHRERRAHQPRWSHHRKHGLRLRCHRRSHQRVGFQALENQKARPVGRAFFCRFELIRRG